MNDFHTIIIIKDEKHILGKLLKQMPQGDDSFLYEAVSDSGEFYLLKEGEFYYINVGWSGKLQTTTDCRSSIRFIPDNSPQI